MGGLFWLTKAQMRLISPNFPLSHGVARIDDRRVVSGIVFVLKSGLRWRDAPAAYGPHKTLYNRFIRWSRMGLFNRIFAALTEAAGAPETAMIDSTHLKAHRTASSLLKKGLFPRCIGRTKGGLNSKLHAVCNDQGRPLILALTEGQTSDYKGAALIFDRLPNTRALIGDKGYHADWLRAALVARGIAPCIPPKTNRIEPIPYDRTLYKARHKIEIMFGRLKDWRRVHTRYDRCAPHIHGRYRHSSHSYLLALINES
jgi:transposase